MCAGKDLPSLERTGVRSSANFSRENCCQGSERKTVQAGEESSRHDKGLGETDSGKRAGNSQSCDDSDYHYIVTPGEIFLGRYRMREQIGKGSFGQVVRAEDLKSKREVAIKIIKRLEKIAAAAALPNMKRADDRHKGFDETDRHDEGVDETASEGDQGDVDEEGDSSVADNEAEEVDTVDSGDVAGGRHLIVNRTDSRFDDAEETETGDDESDNGTNGPLVVPDPVPTKLKLSHREALRLERETVPIDKIKGGSSTSGQGSADGGEDQLERKSASH
jgi:hypothetical protein